MIIHLALYPFACYAACACGSEKTTRASVSLASPNPSTWAVYADAFGAPIADRSFAVGIYECSLCGESYLTARQMAICDTLFAVGGEVALANYLATLCPPEPIAFDFEYAPCLQRGKKFGWWCQFAERRVAREGIIAGWHETDPWAALAMLLGLPMPEER